MADSFRILTVCTANRCRSPLAELLLRRELVLVGIDEAAVAVESAGTNGLDGQTIDSPTAAEAQRYGADPGTFASRRLTEAMCQRADLILTATRAHKSLTLEQTPLALPRTFTLLEFPAAARLALRRSDWAGVGLPGLVRAAAAVRTELEPACHDIDDPVGGSTTEYAAAAQIIAAAVHHIASYVSRALGGISVVHD